MRLVNYIMIISGIMIMLYVAGVDTSAGYVLNTLQLAQNPGNINTDNSATEEEVSDTTNIYTAVMIILGLAVSVGVVIGFFTKTSPENYLIAPLALILMAFVGDILILISTIGNDCGDAASTCGWVYWIIVFIMAPLALGYLLAILDWWRGKD